MGLFSVNMAKLYGEGARAFQRLQEEFLEISDEESVFAWVDKEAKASDLHGLLADSPLHFRDSGNIGPLPDRHFERKPLQTTNLGLNFQRSLISGQMPLLCGHRSQAGYLSVATAPVGDQYARCRLAELQACMYVRQTGNLYFPQIIPHLDRYHPVHETVIRYSLSVSPRTTQDNIYVRDRQRAGMHPMSSIPDSDTGRAGFSDDKYEVSKFSTHMDLVLQFKRPADQKWVFIILGIVDAKTLGFVAGVGYPAFVECHYGSSMLNVSINSQGTSKSFFAKAFLPIGSSFDAGTLHRVSVKQLLADPKHIPVADNQVQRLEIEVTALDQFELRSGRSRCRVQ